MLPKPPIGDPCNGCGLCCQVQICGCGSYVLGMVKRYGERAPGPCPALVKKGESYACGLMLRPKDYIKSDRGVTPLREAVALLIGAGAGCDEAGDEPDDTALPKTRRVAADYIRAHGVEKLQHAVLLIYGGGKQR